MTPIQYIDTPEHLAALCARIENAPWIALDTEFLREKTYYPKFCLLQIATPEWVACIDPLALPNLDSLLDAIYDPKIVKVFHSCRQDLEIFYQLTGKLPEPIFDTQVAAPLLGFQDNPGYAMLVSSFLNINLNKAHTRADWSKRPLTDAEIQYAADDVIYLCEIYQIIVQKLNALGRADWLRQDFAELSNPDNYQVHPENAWHKIKGKNKLTGRQLSIVQSLAEWREKTAQLENRPKSWLLRDEMIFDLAKLQPDSIAGLAQVRGINERTVNRHGADLCQLISAAKNRPPISLKERIRFSKKTQQQEAVLDILTAIVRLRADENSLNPAIIASRRDLESLFLDEEESCPLLHGWRYAMAGRELIGILNGKLLLGVKNGKLDIIGNETAEGRD
ncbi:MAG: ribonuclease D [Gammaproteobacteria bacterium]